MEMIVDLQVFVSLSFMEEGYTGMFTPFFR